MILVTSLDSRAYDDETPLPAHFELLSPYQLDPHCLRWRSDHSTAEVHRTRHAHFPRNDNCFTATRFSPNTG
jgi:hypothetical protein